MAKTGLTKAQEARLQKDAVLRASYLEKTGIMGEREAFAAAVKEAPKAKAASKAKAKEAAKEQAKKTREANKAAARERKATLKAEEKAKKAAQVQASREATKAAKAAALGAAKEARKKAQKERELAKAAAQSAVKATVKSAQERTLALHEGVKPAPAPEFLDPGALILLPEAERKRVLALGGKSQRKLLARELSRMARGVRTEIKSLKTARRQRLRVLKVRAKEALAMIRKRIAEVRERYLREMATLRAETAETRRGRLEGIAEVDREVGAAIRGAEGRQRAIRDTQSEIRAMRPEPSPKALAAAKMRRESRQESDQAVAYELEKTLPGAEKWWNAEGSKQSRFAPKNVPQKMSRAEHVAKTLAETPEILDNFFEKRAAQVLKAKEAELKALSKRQERRAIQRRGRAGRRVAMLPTKRPSRGMRNEGLAPFLPLAIDRGP